MLPTLAKHLRSVGDRHTIQRPHTPPIPYLSSPFSQWIAPPSSLSLSGGPLVLTDTGGSRIDNSSPLESAVSVTSSSSKPDPIRLTITKHRWKQVSDFVNGDVPVVEIRPYNKSDGRRYVYVRVEGSGSESGSPIKARFRLRRSSTGEWLGYLSRASKEIDTNPCLSNVKPFDIEISSSNLTLVVGEPILKQLDGPSNGARGNNTLISDQELQMVVSTTTYQGRYEELAVLPFFRIKRKHKRPERDRDLVTAKHSRKAIPIDGSKKRPKTLSIEKHDPIPSICGLSSSLDLMSDDLGDDLVADLSSSANNSSCSQVGDSFLLLSVDDQVESHHQYRSQGDIGAHFPGAIRSAR